MKTTKSKVVLLTIILFIHNHACFADPWGHGDEIIKGALKLLFCCISLTLNVFYFTENYLRPTLFNLSIAIFSAILNVILSIYIFIKTLSKASFEFLPLILFGSIFIFVLVSLIKAFKEIKKFDFSQQTNFIYIALHY